MIGPAAALAVCRFLHDGALMLLWGMAAYIAVLLPRPLVAETLRRLGAVPLAAAVVVLLASAAVLPLEAALIGDGWSDAIRGEMLLTILFDSTVGVAIWATAGTGVLLLLAFAVPGERRIAAVAVATLLGIAALSLSGHASMDQGWRLIAHRGNDILHMLSGGAWLGALVPFVGVLKMLDLAEFHSAAQLALRRFSVAGHFAVALVIATGIVNAALILKRWPNIWSSPYEILLGLKVCAVGVMVGLAIWNRYILVPALGAAPVSAIRSIRRASLVEISLGFVVVGLVAVFGMLDPA